MDTFGVDLATDESYTCVIVLFVGPNSTHIFNNFVPQYYFGNMHKNKLKRLQAQRNTAHSSIREEKTKTNKYAIITIIFKNIAKTMRDKYRDLNVEAHPLQNPGCARLVIRRIQTDEKATIDIYPGPPRRVPFGIRPMRRCSNQFSADVTLARKNRVAKKKNPSEFTFVLDAPDSLCKFEEWIESIIENWFYVGTHPGQIEFINNINRSTTL